MTGSGEGDDERFQIHLRKPPSRMSEEELDDLAAELAEHMELGVDEPAGAAALPICAEERYGCGTTA